MGSYARVTMYGQSLDAQLDAIQAAGTQRVFLHSFRFEANPAGVRQAAVPIRQVGGQILNQ